MDKKNSEHEHFWFSTVELSCLQTKPLYIQLVSELLKREKYLIPQNLILRPLNRFATSKMSSQLGICF